MCEGGFLIASAGYWDRPGRRAVVNGWVGWLRRRGSALVVGGGLGMVCAGLVVREWPDLLVRLGPCGPLLWIHSYLLPWGGLTVLAGCVGLARGPAARLIVGGLALVAAVVLCALPVGVGIGSSAYLTGRASDGSCRQTTRWSCGPAAAVMLLSRFGVEEDEAEMARRCGTIPGRGTSDYGLWCGVRTRLDPARFDVGLVQAGSRRAESLPTPALLSIRASPGRRHCVVLLELRNGTAVIADPDRSKTFLLSSEQLERQWQGSAVVVKPLWTGPPFGTQ